VFFEAMRISLNMSLNIAFADIPET